VVGDGAHGTDGGRRGDEQLVGADVGVAADLARITVDVDIAVDELVEAGVDYQNTVV
jgi:hypothetical protein